MLRPLEEFKATSISHEPPVRPRDEENSSRFTAPVIIILGDDATCAPATFSSSSRAFLKYAVCDIPSGGARGPAARQFESNVAGPENDPIATPVAFSAFNATFVSALIAYLGVVYVEHADKNAAIDAEIMSFFDISTPGYLLLIVSENEIIEWGWLNFSAEVNPIKSKGIFLGC